MEPLQLGPEAPALHATRYSAPVPGALRWVLHAVDRSAPALGHNPSAFLYSALRTRTCRPNPHRNLVICTRDQETRHLRLEHASTGLSAPGNRSIVLARPRPPPSNASLHLLHWQPLPLLIISCQKLGFVGRSATTHCLPRNQRAYRFLWYKSSPVVW